MKKLILILPALLAAVLMTSCVEDGYAYHDDGPAYSGSNSVDFYYTSGRPYSRSYGPLEYRDDRYYYSRGGRYVTYDRPTYAYRGAGSRVVNRNVNVRNVTYNDRDYATYGRADSDRRYYNNNNYRGNRSVTYNNNGYRGNRSSTYSNARGDGYVQGGTVRRRSTNYYNDGDDDAVVRSQRSSTRVRASY